MANTKVQTKSNVPFGDERLLKRYHKIKAQLSNLILASIPEAIGNRDQAKAFYRWINNIKVKARTITDLQRQECMENIKHLKGQEILVLQDTTELNYSGKRSAPNLGILGFEHKKGMYLHTQLMLSAEGVCMGIFNQVFKRYELENLGKLRDKRKETDIKDKKSGVWLEQLKLLVKEFRKHLEYTVISIGDREADIYEMFTLKRTPNVHYIIRSSMNRRVDTGTKGSTSLSWDVLGSFSPAYTYQQRVPTKKDRNQYRIATLQVRFGMVKLHPPKRKGKKLEPVTVWMVETSELNTPEGEEKTCWRLITSLDVNSNEMAIKIIDYYAKRWTIERFHYVLKQGLKVEEMQIEEQNALQNAILLRSSQAINILALSNIANEFSQSEGLLEDSNIATIQDYEILYKVVVKKYAKTRVRMEKPTVREFAELIALLGSGKIQKKRRIGIISLWKGWLKFEMMKEFMEALNTYG